MDPCHRCAALGRRDRRLHCPAYPNWNPAPKLSLLFECAVRVGALSVSLCLFLSLSLSLSPSPSRSVSLSFCPSCPGPKLGHHDCFSKVCRRRTSPLQASACCPGALCVLAPLPWPWTSPTSFRHCLRGALEGESGMRLHESGGRKTDPGSLGVFGPKRPEALLPAPGATRPGAPLLALAWHSGSGSVQKPSCGNGPWSLKYFQGQHFSTAYCRNRFFKWMHAILTPRRKPTSACRKPAR